jgi:hypothetical protein
MILIKRRNKMTTKRAKLLKDMVKLNREMGVRFRTIHVVEDGVEATTVTLAAVPDGEIVDGRKKYIVAFAIQSFKDEYNKLEGQIRAAGRLAKPGKHFLIEVEKGQRILEVTKNLIVDYIQAKHVPHLSWITPDNLV